MRQRQLARSRRLEALKTESSRRRLALPGWLVEELTTLLARRGLTAADTDALVLVNRDGNPLDYAHWRLRTWQPACRAAGLPALRFHDLRSMSGTALVAVGADVKTAQTRLGHSTPSMTLGIYARATADADRRAAEAIGNLFRPLRARSAHTH